MAIKTQAVSPFPMLIAVTIALHLLRSVPSQSHDAPLTLSRNTTHFTLSVHTSRNVFSQRCALVVTHENRLKTRCDIVRLQIIQTRNNGNARVVVPEYIAMYHDTLSRTYNEGLYFVAQGVHLSVRPEELPVEGKTVHFPYASNGFDIGSAWFAMFPSNASRGLFQNWVKQIPNARVEQIEQVGLNRARRCAAQDVVCHSRRSVIRRVCDGAKGEGCESDTWVEWTWDGIVGMTVVIVIASGIDVGRRIIPRRIRWKVEIERFGILGLLLGIGILLCGMEWVSLVEFVGRLVGVSVRRRFEGGILARAEIFRGVSELRGRWEGYAYIFKDGVWKVRVAGPGASVVVWVVGVVGVLREVLVGIVWCLGVVVISIGGSRTLLGSMGRKKVDSEDDYADRRDIASLRKKSRDSGRNFLVRKGMN